MTAETTSPELELQPQVKINIFDPGRDSFHETTIEEAIIIRDKFLENLPSLNESIEKGIKEQEKRDSYNNFLKSSK